MQETPSHPMPAGLMDLFMAFNWMALQGFGGVMAIVHRELVEKKGWLTDEEFVEDWSVAQLLPGANIINLAMVLGNRYFGLRGAVTALAGMMIAPTFLVVGLALLYSHFANNPGVVGALRSMGAVVAGLIGATGLRLIRSLKNHPLQRPVLVSICVICFLMIAIMRWPLLYAMLGLGAVSCMLTYRRLKP
ncbi:chromate transporter [Oxalobacteraceae bacterium CAVE-383]|nr:chromate transporter [Oxalobacteraceae bacterium CAVE-383]